jgi:aspartyl-tRNA(Asn)/glutamyl-tRNA(Gln) amidotransferase subunit A
MTPDAWHGSDQGQPIGIGEFGEALRSRRISAVDATHDSIAAIEASQPAINAFIRVTRELAMAQARRIDELRAAGTDLGALMGAPIAVKDVFDVAGLPTTAGSHLFANRIASANAEAVGRLVAAGGVIAGKANMDQFALGPHQADYGRTNCPADPTRYAGGSSGGSAAAVAAGLVVAALGSDAGGSTRFPAACCGVVGFKPTFGAVPTAGTFPTFPSVDHVGAIASDVAGVRATFATISNSFEAPTELAHRPRIAVLSDWPEGCDDHVARGTRSALAALADAGASLSLETTVAGQTDSMNTLIEIIGPEAYIALAAHLPSDGEGVTTALRNLLAAGRDVSAISYLRAQARKEELRGAVDNVLADNDVLAMPTCATVAWRWADIDKESDSFQNPATRFLPLANLTGHPAISVPLPRRDSLPVGLQLVGRRAADFQLLDIAAWVEVVLARALSDKQ